MVIILRTLGVLASIGTLFYAIFMIYAFGDGNGGVIVGSVVSTIVSLAFTIL